MNKYLCIDFENTWVLLKENEIPKYEEPIIFKFDINIPSIIVREWYKNLDRAPKIILKPRLPVRYKFMFTDFIEIVALFSHKGKLKIDIDVEDVIVDVVEHMFSSKYIYKNSVGRKTYEIDIIPNKIPYIRINLIEPKEGSIYIENKEEDNV